MKRETTKETSMPKPEQPPTPDKIELTAELKVLVHEEVDSRVEKRLSDAQRWLDTSIGWATKILAIAAALFVGAMAFFGFQTINDFKKSLQAHNTKLDEISKQHQTKVDAALAEQTSLLKDTILKQTEAKMAELMPNVQEFRGKVDEFYESALVASYNAQIDAAQLDRWKFVELADADRERIQSALKRPNLTASRFGDLLRLLQNSWKGNADFGAFLKFLLTTILDKKQGITESDRKAMLLFSALQKNGDGGAANLALSVVKDKDNSAAVRAAALRCFCEVSGPQSAKDLEDIEPTVDEGNKYTIWACLARWNPEAKPVQTWLDDLEKRPGGASVTELGMAWKMLSGIMKQTSRGPFQEPQTPGAKDLDAKRIKLASRVATILVSSKAQVVYRMETFNRRRGGSLYLNQGNTSFFIDSDSLFSDNFQTFGKIVTDYLKNNQTNQLNQLLEVICVRGETFAEESQHFISGVSLELDEKAVITFSQSKLSKADIIGRALLLPGKDSRPMIVWRDRLGVVKSEPLQRIESAEGVTAFEQALVPLNFDSLNE